MHYALTAFERANAGYHNHAIALDSKWDDPQEFPIHRQPIPNVQTHMAQLSDLPVELLQRIAAFLSCSSALSLTRVSHKLHAACYVQLVFKRIALHSLGDTLIIPRSESVCWPDGPRILKNASLSQIVRVAHAVERAARRAGGRYGSPRAIREMQVESAEEFQADVEQWLPQLLAWHHPAYRYLQDTSLLPVHEQLGRRITTPNPVYCNDGRASFIVVGFCLAYFALQSFSQLEDDAYASFETEHHLMKMSSDYMLSVCWGIKPPRGGFCRPTDSFDLIQGSACTVPMLYAIIGSGLFRRLPFPLPSKMPFSSFMDIPWVFSGDSESMSTCHVEKMTEAAFLTGSWMGVSVVSKERHDHAADAMT